MNASTRLNTQPATEEATRAANVVAPVIRVRSAFAGNDATVAEAPAHRDEIEAWAWHASAANGFGDPRLTDTPYPTWPSTYEVYREARVERAAALRRMIAAVVETVRAAAIRAYERYRQYRATRITCDELSALDDRALRDLGMSRDEIQSFAAETAGLAEQTRVRVRQAAYGLADFSEV